MWTTIWTNIKAGAVAVFDWVDLHPWPSACMACLVAGIIIGLLL